MPTIIIQQTTAINAGADTQAVTSEHQSGDVSSDILAFKSGDVTETVDQGQFTGSAITGRAASYEGITSFVKTINPAAISVTTSGSKILAFSTDFSRGIFVAAAVGVASLIEKEFDSDAAHDAANLSCWWMCSRCFTWTRKS